MWPCACNSLLRRMSAIVAMAISAGRLLLSIATCPGHTTSLILTICWLYLMPGWQVCAAVASDCSMRMGSALARSTSRIYWW